MSAPGGGAVTEIRREVTARRHEYERTLRLAFPEGLEGGPDAFRVQRGDVQLEVRVRPGPVREIALLRLQTLDVTLRFSGADSKAHEDMLRRMDLAMRRGGG